MYAQLSPSDLRVRRTSSRVGRSRGRLHADDDYIASNRDLLSEPCVAQQHYVEVLRRQLSRVRKSEASHKKLIWEFPKIKGPFLESL